MKTRSSSAPLVLVAFFSVQDSTTHAWTLSSINNLATPRKTSRRRQREQTLVEQRQIQFDQNVRRRWEKNQVLLVHAQSDDDDDDDYDVVEEEFYSEYENMYFPSRPAEESSNVQTFKEKNRQVDDSPTPPSPKSRKVELAKAWDEALLERNADTLDATDGNNEGRISNISDLQKKLQEFQKRNQAGPLEDYSLKEPENELPLNTNSGKRQVAQDKMMTNDQYLKILQKAQERLSKLIDSDESSLAFQKREKKTLISNMSGLQARLNEIQRDASAKGNSENESLSSPDEPPLAFQKTEKQTLISNMSSLQDQLNQIQQDASAKESSGVVLSSIDEPPKAKFLDDDTLTEWKNLDNQMKEEAAARNTGGTQSSSPLISKETTPESFLAEEAAILDALRSQEADNWYDDNQDYVDISVERGDETFDPNDIPSEYKKFVSNYEVTDDGGVFLSPEAYQEACKNANPDGSLNFSWDDNGNDSKNRQTLESAIFDDEPPMAPYGDQGAAGSRKNASIQDLTQEASRNLEFARNNPEAQEELHRRLMAEFEDDKSTNDEFDNELLLDPEKAIAFWNQEYMEEQKVESNALEDLLDEKLRELEKEEADQRNKPGNSEANQFRTIDAQKQNLKGDENIFFASKEERIDRIRMLERDRRIHAKNIAKYYEEYPEDSSWGNTSESKEVEEITRRQAEQQERIEVETMDKAVIETIPDISDDINLDLDNSAEVVLPNINEQTEDETDWVFVEDPESLEDSFYWNEGTGEMRRDPPDEW